MKVILHLHVRASRGCKTDKTFESVSCEMVVGLNLTADPDGMRGNIEPPVCNRAAVNHENQSRLVQKELRVSVFHRTSSPL